MRIFSKLLIISVFAVVALLGGIAEAWADGSCNCTVTSSSGSVATGNTTECTLHVVSVKDINCKTITIAATLSGVPGTADKPVEIKLAGGVPLDGKTLVGTLDNNGKPTVRLVLEAKNSTMAVNMLGGAILKNVAISAPGKTAIQVSGSGNTIDNVAITGSGTAIALLDSKSVDNHFINNTFSGNTSAIVLNGGNTGIPAPMVVGRFKTGDGTYSLLVSALGGSTVKAYLADAATAPQGLKEVGSGQKIDTVYCGGDLCFNDYYRIDLSGASGTSDIVLISDNTAPGTGTTAFSDKIKASVGALDAAAGCMSTPWYLQSVINLKSKSSAESVWDYDLDGDGFKNGEEDKDKNCHIDATESKPDDKKSMPFQFALINTCASNPALCFLIDLCKTNPELCKQPADTKPAAKDFDLDGKTDDVDVCPEAKDAEQLDTDGDGIGDACDPDRDNDGLTNAQEGVAGTNPVKADHDGDGYCDGPAWGKIVNGAPTCKPSDNCPLSSNAGQYDTDEDGIGDDCDLSLKDAFTSNTDSDIDGVKDFQENGLGDNCPAIKNPDQKDTDGDKVGDACDSDDDNDGLLDVVENSTRYTFYDKGKAFVKTALLNPLSSESDADPQDGKSDNSPDNVDMCPVIAAGAATDACDAILASALTAVVNDTATDDCPTVKNFGLKGASKDVACDADIDGDGVKNADEDKQHTHFWEADSDHYKYDFLKNQGEGADGHNDKNDVCPANFGLTNVDFCSGKTAVVDTDKDGKFDKQDNCQNKANPDQADLDKDNVGDACDDDIDGDGLKNDGDKCPKVSDPSNVCSQAKPTPDANPKFTPLAGPVTQDFQGGGGCALVATTSSTSSAGLCLFLLFGAFVVLRMRLVDKTR